MPRFRVFLTEDGADLVEVLKFLGDIPDADLDGYVHRDDPDCAPDISFPFSSAALAVVIVPALRAAQFERLAEESPLVYSCVPAA